MKHILLFLIGVIGCSQVYPQAGTLDPSFGQSGIVVTDFGATVNINRNECSRILLCSDGSFFLVFEMNEQSMITHRWPDGSLDKNYGTNGYSNSIFMLNPSAELQPDGKIVLGGHTMINNSMDFVLARLNKDGSLDPTFSSDGVVSFDFSSTADNLYDLALQPDGKILAVGRSSGTAGYFSIARLNPDGSFDTSFSEDGKLIGDINSNFGIATAVAVQPDGKIVLVGNTQSHIIVARYLPNGVLDNSFSGDGTAFVSTGLYSSSRSVLLQPDGKILVAGSVVEAGAYNFLVLRFLTDGTMDLSFSGDGKQITDFGADDTIEALALQPDGKIIAVGSTLLGAQADFAIARYQSDGSADNGFSGDGKQTTAIGNSVDFAFDVALQPDGRILAAGWSKISDGYSYSAVRYLADGSLDLSFADHGKMVDYKPAGYGAYQTVVVQTDGSMIAAGYADTGKGVQFAAARYNRSGTLDAGFGQNGKQTIDFGLSSSQVYEVALQPDGKIILAGHAGDDSGFYFALARLNINGSLDSSFDGDGKVVLDRGLYAKMVIQLDGKIVVAAQSEPSQLATDIVLLRCLSNGAIDRGFGVGGKVVTDLGSSSDKIFDLLLQPDGKLVVVGAYDYNGDSKIALVRYSADGILDGSFGNGGIVITSISERPAVFAAALQADGKIVAAGNLTIPGVGNDLLLLRYNSNGSLDNSFSQDGKIVFDMGSTSEVAQAVIVQKDGKIITAGYTHDGRSNVSALARFNSDGTFDSSFSVDGKIIAQPDRALLFDLAIDDNRLYAVGSGISDGTRGGIVSAYLLAALKTCPESFTVSVPYAMSLDKGVDRNTVYPGYGPASQIYLYTNVAGGKLPYTYLWSNGATSEGITVGPSVNTNYTVNVTDAAGCSITASKQVYAVNVQCGNSNGKVVICQVSPGNSHSKTICVATAAVAANLKNGSKLGDCLQGAVVSRVKEVNESESHLLVYPNPSNTVFKLQLHTAEPGGYILLVRDVLGRVVEQRKMNGRGVIEIGHGYGRGVYLVSVVQKTRTMTVQIIKE